jgi:hypothetical protein
MEVGYASDEDDEEEDVCPACGGPRIWIGDVWICVANFCNLYNEN